MSEIQDELRRWCSSIRAYCWDDALPHLERLLRRAMRDYDRRRLHQVRVMGVEAWARPEMEDDSILAALRDERSENDGDVSETGSP